MTTVDKKKFNFATTTVHLRDETKDAIQGMASFKQGPYTRNGHTYNYKIEFEDLFALYCPYFKWLNPEDRDGGKPETSFVVEGEPGRYVYGNVFTNQAAYTLVGYWFNGGSHRCYKEEVLKDGLVYAEEVKHRKGPVFFNIPERGHNFQKRVYLCNVGVHKERNEMFELLNSFCKCKFPENTTDVKSEVPEEEHDKTKAEVRDWLGMKQEVLPHQEDQASSKRSRGSSRGEVIVGKRQR